MMAFLYIHQFVILSFIFTFTCVTSTVPVISLANGLHSLNQPLTGSCQSASLKDEVTYYLANASFPCNGQQDDKPFEEEYLLDRTGNVTVNAINDKLFNISELILRVYNVWCKTETSVNCRYAVTYDISISEGAHSSLYCNLTFAFDGLPNFERPQAVQWLRNGSPVDKSASKILVAEDFNVVDSFRSIEFPLSSEFASLPGLYECQYTQTNAKLGALSATFLKEGKPENEYIKFEPMQEQYSDGDVVTLTCAFTGHPSPNITWYLNDIALERESRVETVGSLTVSYVPITELEDSTDKGEYKCVAVNEEGNDTATKVLHARDNLAPLWPFLGIVIQVIVLAICITLGEKYRKKELAKKRQLVLDETATRT